MRSNLPHSCFFKYNSIHLAVAKYALLLVLECCAYVAFVFGNRDTIHLFGDIRYTLETYLVGIASLYYVMH